MRGGGIPALVIANGDLPPDREVLALARRTRAAGGIVVCADGGARHAARLRIRPDIVLGDLDSLDGSVRRALPAVPVLRVADQESTDLEKALRFCLVAGCGSAEIVGAVGDRLDHSTGALGCLAKYGAKLRLTLHDRGGELRLLGRRERFSTRPGELFSLIPLGRCTGILLAGAQYPLRRETLELGVRDGISNRAAGREVRVSHRTGRLFLYRPARPGKRA